MSIYKGALDLVADKAKSTAVLAAKQALAKAVANPKTTNATGNEVAPKAAIGFNALSAEDVIYKDMYRDGVLISSELNIGNNDIVGLSQWDPISRQVSTIEDTESEGRLASIRYFDTITQKESTKLLGTSKFFLENVSQSYGDRYQIIQTFGDQYAFFFGKHPKIFSFSGQLLNLENYNWRLDFIDMYENYWSGTKAVENQSMVLLTFSYEQIYGYFLKVSTNLTAVNDRAAPFSFQFLVVKVIPLNRSVDKADNVPPPLESLSGKTESATATDAAKKVNTKQKSPKSQTLLSQAGSTILTPGQKAASSSTQFGGGGDSNSSKFMQSQTPTLTPFSVIVSPIGASRAEYIKKARIQEVVPASFEGKI